MKKFQPKQIGTKVVTGKVRLSYANVHEPRSVDGVSDPKYSTSLIIPKSDTATIEAIQKAVDEAITLGKDSKWGGKTPPNLKLPLRDGDEDRPEDYIYADAFFLNANSTRKPEIVDLKGRKDLGPDEVYSGCYARVSLNFFPYNVSGNRGVGCGLGNIQKIDDGEPLGGFSSAADDFDFEESDDGLADFLQ